MSISVFNQAYLSFLFDRTLFDVAICFVACKTTTFFIARVSGEIKRPFTKHLLHTLQSFSRTSSRCAFRSCSAAVRLAASKSSCEFAFWQSRIL